MSLKKIIKTLLPQKIHNLITPYNKQIINFKTLAKEYGQFQSIKKWSCLDGEGNPIPWYTYPAIEYLSNLDFSDKTILEWGGGNSSLFWAKRCKKLITVEVNPMWHSKLLSFKTDNQELYLKENVDINSNDNYVDFPKTLNTLFDVIIIDSAERKKCAQLAASILNANAPQGAMIILDNSDWYPQTCQILRQQDFIQVDFHGFAPINAYTHTTSLFLTRNFCFVPLDNLQPHYSKMAIHVQED